jgi:predicted aspartyl protease
MSMHALALLLLAVPAQVPLAPSQPTTPPGRIAAPAPPAVPPETIGIAPDPSTRMTVPVRIDGRGPYGFIVDTGAERTVISRELAQTLALDAGEPATLSSMSEVSQIATVVIPNLGIGRRTVSDIHAPALSRSDLGGDGLLGIDSLQSQRVEMDFRRHQMTVTPASRAESNWPQGTIVVTARKRHGHLMLVDASFDGERVYVIVDTGSQVTVGNSALRDRLARHHRLGAMTPIHLLSVTGGLVPAQYTIAREIMVGNAGVRNLPVAFADVDPFHQLDLTDRPALLLGMDALRLFDRVSFDFANRRVRFLLPGSSALERPVRMAAARP